jgi:hypothetical protein
LVIPANKAGQPWLVAEESTRLERESRALQEPALERSFEGCLCFERPNRPVEQVFRKKNNADDWWLKNGSGGLPINFWSVGPFQSKAACFLVA